MVRCILVAQLLTVLLEPRGVDFLTEAFPEEFRSRTHAPERSHASAPIRRPTGWSHASDDLVEALLLLVDRHLVTINADGHVGSASAPASADVTKRSSSDCERDEGFGYIEREAEHRERASCERGERFEFERRRLEA